MEILEKYLDCFNGHINDESTEKTPGNPWATSVTEKNIYYCNCQVESPAQWELISETIRHIMNSPSQGPIAKSIRIDLIDDCEGLYFFTVHETVTIYQN